MNAVSTLAPPAIALLIPVLVVVLVKLCARRSRDDLGDGNGNGGSDGRRPRHPTPQPPSPSGGVDPDWWPDFEGAFAAYVGARSSALVDSVPSGNR